MGMKNDDYLRALQEMRPQHESTQPRHGRLKDSASRICRVHAEVKQKSSQRSFSCMLPS